MGKLRDIIISSFLAGSLHCGGGSGNNISSLDQGSKDDLSRIRNDAGIHDVYKRDGGLDSKADLYSSYSSDCSESGGEIHYPIARVNCPEIDPDDCLCVHRPVVDRTYCWDFSESEAGPGRRIETYRFFPDIIGYPDFKLESMFVEMCFVYGFSQRFISRLEVEDDLRDSDTLDFYNYVIKKNEKAK